MSQQTMIQLLQNEEEAKICSQYMIETEPWITLQRDFDESMATILHPDKEVYIAKVEDKIAGFIILNMHGALQGYIQTLCVGDDYRGQGIGSQLMQYAEERIFRDSPNVFIMVSSFNPNAQRLYQRLGYEVIGELKDLIVVGHSEILLRKTGGSLRDFQNEHP